MLLSKVLNDFYVLPMGQSEIVGFHIEDLIRITWHDSDTCDNHEQLFLDQEIQEVDPSMRGGFTVTMTDGDPAAFIALDGAALKPERLLINNEGGLIQCVLSERVPYEVMVIDYENTYAADADQVYNIPQDDGTTAKAAAHVTTAMVDPAFIAGAFASIN